MQAGRELDRMGCDKETAKMWQAEAVAQKQQVDKLSVALLTIWQESTDQGAKDCAADALRSIGIAI